MIRIGLTGSVASGKSAVAEVWRDAGVAVLDADDLARAVVEPGTPGLDRVVEAFGPGILAADGTLDRAAVRDRVFRDPGDRERLESILHPLIARARDRWLEERRDEGAEVVAAEIPLLFETGMEGVFDRIVVVDAPVEERLRRLARDRGLAEAEARRIMDAQMDPAEKRRRADHVLVNDGSLEELRRKARTLLDEIRGEIGEESRIGGESAIGGEGEIAPTPLMRIDLHMHTLASRDCLSDPEEVLAAALARGIDRIAITDHDRLGAALEMHARYPDRVIPGEEVKTAEGVDVIGLYLSKEIPKGTPAEETCRRIAEQGGLVYLPHPFAPGKGGDGRLAEALAGSLDVVEVFNARLHRDVLNRRAADFARRHGLPGGAGSDAHSPGEVGRGSVELPHHENRPEALLAALRSARILGVESPRWVHLLSTWAKVRKHLPGALTVAEWRARTAGDGPAAKDERAAKDGSTTREGGA